MHQGNIRSCKDNPPNPLSLNQYVQHRADACPVGACRELDPALINDGLLSQLRGPPDPGLLNEPFFNQLSSNLGVDYLPQSDHTTSDGLSSPLSEEELLELDQFLLESFYPSDETDPFALGDF